MDLPLASGLSAEAASDAAWMEEAIGLAEAAARAGEVPVGAIVVAAGVRVAGAHNLCESLPDATAHAERLAIGLAAAALGRWRLSDCTLFVTLEPCMMCAGALVQARVARVVFGASARVWPGAREPGGWLTTRRPLGAPAAAGGLLAARSEALLGRFFAARRGGADGLSGATPEG